MTGLRTKMIIRNYTDLDDFDVLDYIQSVVALGKISNHKTSYCNLTTFLNNYTVAVEPRGDTTTFYFYKEGGKYEGES